MEPVIVRPKTIAFSYNFAKDGGAIGSLIAPVMLPAGAVVARVGVSVLQTFASSGGAASISMGFAPAGTQLMKNVLISTAPFPANPSIATISFGDPLQRWGGANVLPGTNVNIYLSIGLHALTAGAAIFYIEYD